MGKVTSRRTARRQTANGRAGTPIEKLLAETRLKLIETGTHNRLIHTKRSRALTITGNASDDVFANLVRENKPTAYSPDLDPIDPSAGSEVFANFPPAFPPSRACCNLKPDSRKNRLRKIARRTRRCFVGCPRISPASLQTTATVISKLPDMVPPNRDML
jgi:hypothetical protein